MRVIRSVPLRLAGDPTPAVLEVRGEVFMTRRSFAELNRRGTSQGEKTFVNPRNAAAGSTAATRPEGHRQPLARPLLHGVGETEGWQPPRRHSAVLEALRGFGLRTCPETATVEGVAGCHAYYSHLGARRDSLGYDIDGVVYKVDRLDC